MRIFQITELLDEQGRTGQPWLEFLREPALSLGIYHLKAGETDPQQPHTEDEAYYILSGRASFQDGDRHEAVGPGTVIYVERGAEHRFYDITEDLTALVFFAPAEGSLAGSTARSA